MNETTPPPAVPTPAMQHNATSQEAVPEAVKRRRWEKTFLAELRRTGNHSAAARAARIHRATSQEAAPEAVKRRRWEKTFLAALRRTGRPAGELVAAAG